MQNTANDELLSEVTLYDNTYRRNKVTQTLKPKTISSSVTQKMVDEYKLDLLQDRKNGLSTAEFKAFISAKPKTLDITADEKKASTAYKEYSGAYDTYIKSVSDFDTLNKRIKKNELELLKNQDKLSRVSSGSKKVSGSKLSEKAKELSLQLNPTEIKKQAVIVDALEDEKKKLYEEWRKIDTASDFKIMENKKQEYEESIKDVKKTQEANRQKLTEYKKLLESKTSTQLPEQAPGENGDEYQKRLEEFLQPDINDAYIQSTIAYDQIKILKSNFSSLFNMNNSRRLAVVEGVIKELPDDARSELNTKWIGFHKRYREIYGFDNANVRTQELLNLINNFIDTDIPGAKPKTIAIKSTAPTVTGLESKSTAPIETGLELILSSKIPDIAPLSFPVDTSSVIAPLIPDGKHYKGEGILPDSQPQLFVILIEYNNRQFIGVSQSGVIGSYTVKPHFSIFRSAVEIFNRDVTDIKNSEIVKPFEQWAEQKDSGLFNGNQYEEFKSTFFTIDGKKKNTKGDRVTDC